jgi:hypothetical protein
MGDGGWRLEDKDPFFGDRGTGDFALCVKGEVDA